MSWWFIFNVVKTHGERAEHENEVPGSSPVKWIHFRWCFSLCCPVLGPWPWHLVQSREGFPCWRPKIDLSHFTSWCCCPLPKSTLTRTTAPLFASVCSGEPCTSALCTEPLSNLSLHSCRSSSPPVSFFDCLGVHPPPPLSFLFLCLLYSFFSFLISQFVCSFAALSSALLSLPWDQFTCAWPNPFPPHASVIVFSFSTSVFPAVIHQLFIFSTEPSFASANFLPPNSFQIQLNLGRFN